MRILFAASEGLPFVKTGGLADVVQSLPLQLKERGHDVRIVLPLYRSIILKDYDKLTRIGTVMVSSGWIYQPATYYQCEVDGVIYYFIEHQGYFERDNLYGYTDDGERFAFFQRALLDMLGYLNWFPEILQSNDWQTGMLPLLCHTCFYGDDRYQQVHHVFAIHNLAFQGNFGYEMLQSCLGLPNYYYENGSVRFDTGISFLKSGVVYADKVITVSPTYAQEIVTPEGGERLDAVLRYRQGDLHGIVNGIDTVSWDPETDSLLAANYDAKTYKKGKAKNKAALQKELGLKVDPKACVIGLVSRLTRQKGIYLIAEQLESILALPVQFVVLGTGEESAEGIFRYMEDSHKGQAVYYQGYNEELAHRIYAGSDLFMMPSLFEPCGISQMISMRYGTLPFVRETGGLKDTVQPYNEYSQEGNGFSFGPANSEDMMNALHYAVNQYIDHPKGWDGLIQRAMATDVTWISSAQKYEEVYEQCLR